MGTRPSLLHTIGRKNNDGNYEPGNVEWQLEEPQQNNKSDTILIEHNGQRLSLKQWSKVIGISHTAMRERYLKGGDPSVILGPVRGAKRTGRARLLSLGKDTRSVQAWAKVIGISAPSLRKRIDELGWTLERALTQPKRKQ